MLDTRILPWFEEGIADAIFLQKQPNVRWVSGFKGADSYVLVTKNGGFLITDPRYTEQAELECPDFTIVNWRKTGGSVMKAAAIICKEQKLQSVAFEADALSYNTYKELEAETDAALVPTEGVVETLRSFKTEEEIGLMRAACDISCRAFERILGDIQVGVTEKELAAKLSAYMVFEGADTQPYGNILISGPNTSLLHGIPGDRAVQYGDFVLMDFGCQFNGYMSDMTRTVVVGKATDRQKEVYALEKQMVENCEAMMMAGVSADAIYYESIKPIKDTEYLQYHYNRIGHGIGLYVHEMPCIWTEDHTVYRNNMITTIEPGIYIPGWGGVRIEDQLVMKDGGNENLVWSTHDLIEL